MDASLPKRIILEPNLENSIAKTLPIPSVATDGIGKVLAIEFSKLGSNIILLGRDASKLDKVYDQLDQSNESQKHLILEADLALLNNESAHEILKAITSEYNSLDGIINNAAILGTMTTLEDYELSRQFIIL